MRNYIVILTMIVSSNICLGQFSLKGKVKYNNKNADNANIKIENQTKKTNKNGIFYFDKVKKGKQRLIISSDYFTDKSFFVYIEDKNVNVNIDISKEELNYIDDIVVEDEATKNRHETVNSITSRMMLSNIENPISIQTVDMKLIEQQQILTLEGVLQNIPGMYLFSKYAGTTRSLGSRGFRGIYAYKNGIQIYNYTNPDMAGVEKMTAIKGASAILFGEVNPGGALNIESKRPKFKKGGEVSFQVGSWDLFRPTVSFYGALDDKIAYRINSSYQKNNSFIDYVGAERAYINPQILYKLNDKTEIMLNYDYLHDYTVTTQGGVIRSTINPDNEDEVATIPLSKNFGAKDNMQISKSSMADLSLTHKLNDKLSVRLVMGLIKNSRHRNQIERDISKTNKLSSYQQGKPNDSLVRVASIYLNDVEHRLGQFDLIGEDFKTGSLSHKFQLGIDYRNRDWKSPYYRSKVVDTIDIFNTKFNDYYNKDFPALEHYRDRTTHYNAIGLSFQDLISFDKFKILLGLRYSSIRYTSTDLRKDQNTNQGKRSTTRNEGFTPKAAIVYSPEENTSIFASYTNTFDPTTATDTTGKLMDNQTYDQIELGFKGNLMEDKLFVSFTGYYILNSNQITPFYDGANVFKGYVRTGNQRNYGVELDIETYITENLNVNLGYGYINAKYTKSGRYINGSRVFNVPEHQANIWLNYDFKQIDGLSLGLGAFYTGDRKGNAYPKIDFHGIPANKKPHTLKSFTDINASIAYKFDNLKIRANANNILNSKGIYSYRVYSINYSDPTNFSVTTSYSF